MNTVKITISGSDSTFGEITKVIETLFLEVGANVELVLDRENAIMDFENTKNSFDQVKGRNIIIETKSLPWGG